MTDGDLSPQDQTMETVAVFSSITEAAIVRGRLDQFGIRCWLQNELISGQLFQVGTALGGVKLQVASTDLQRVRELFAGDGETGTDSQGPPWTCPRCGNEVDGGFEICWSCQATRDPVPGTGPDPAEADG